MIVKTAQPISHQAAQDIKEYRETWAQNPWPIVAIPFVLFALLILVVALVVVI